MESGGWRRWLRSRGRRAVRVEPFPRRASPAERPRTRWSCRGQAGSGSARQELPPAPAPAQMSATTVATGGQAARRAPGRTRALKAPRAREESPPLKAICARPVPRARRDAPRPEAEASLRRFLAPAPAAADSRSKPRPHRLRFRARPISPAGPSRRLRSRRS